MKEEKWVEYKEEANNGKEVEKSDKMNYDGDKEKGEGR